MEEEYIELQRDGDRIEVLELLQNQYPFYVNPEFSSLKIFQTKECVYLEKTYEQNPSEVVTEAMDFISGFFDPNDSLEENALDFVYELGEYTIMMCFDDVFTEEAIEEILNQH